MERCWSKQEAESEARSRSRSEVGAHDRPWRHITTDDQGQSEAESNQSHRRHTSRGEEHTRTDARRDAGHRTQEAQPEGPSKRSAQSSAHMRTLGSEGAPASRPTSLLNAPRGSGSTVRRESIHVTLEGRLKHDSVPQHSTEHNILLHGP